MTTDTMVENETPVKNALLCPEITDPDDRELWIAITPHDITSLQRREELLDVLRIPYSEWQVEGQKNPVESRGEFSVFYMPPLSRGWVQAGVSSAHRIYEALLNRGYVEEDQPLEEITDVRAFEAQPVSLHFLPLGSGSKNPSSLLSE